MHLLNRYAYCMLMIAVVAYDSIQSAVGPESASVFSRAAVAAFTSCLLTVLKRSFNTAAQTFVSPAFFHKPCLELSLPTNTLPPWGIQAALLD